MKKLLLVVYCISPTCILAQTNELQQAYSSAIEAYRSGDYKSFYSHIQRAHEIHPYHQGILYQAGIAAALNNKQQEAITFLKKAILIQADFNLNIPDLESLTAAKAFQELKKMQEETKRPVINSDTAFVLHDKTLHIESIAPGEKKGVFYLGSIHRRKIVKVENGKATDFTFSAQDDLSAVFGVKVDTRKNILWACASPMPEMANYEKSARSGVFKYDLKTKKLLAFYKPTDESKEYIFGDITLNKREEVFVSDSKNNLIFKVDEVGRKLEQVYSSEEFWNLQGITFSDDGDYLFISDYIRGPFRLDMKTKRLIPLATDVDLSLKAIDGLTFYNNSLIAIQNYIKPMRVTRYQLNKEMDRITGSTIIDRAHPAFNEPTIGCLAGNEFYYVANSQWSGYNDKHELKPEGELQEIVILKTSLK